MNTEKHTEGPWEIHWTGAIVQSKTSCDSCQVEVANPSSCCGPQFPRNINEANARLIAAAPELLEALEDARSDLFYQLEATHGPKWASTYPSIKKADEAIAKARGEA